VNDIPSEMNAIAIPEPGGPEALKPVKIETPAPGQGEALIRVRAAGVNRPDVFQRMGFYPPPPGAPDTPGLEVAGEVVALGQDTGELKVGDRVCSLVAGGGYAEYCVVQTPATLPIPGDLSFVEAAAIPETFFTVWTNLFDRGALKPSETVLIHGGTSGIGTTAIMLAKAFGATVLTTAGSAEKCKAALELGADHAINYKEADFEEAVKAKLGDRGVDVVLDMVGGDYIPKNLNLLEMHGRLIFIAFLNGSKAEIDFMQVMLKRLTISGSTLRARSAAEKGEIADALRAKVWPILEKGQIRPVIDQVVPLAEAAKAHARMESSAHIGKIVLEV